MCTINHVGWRVGRRIGRHVVVDRYSTDVSAHTVHWSTLGRHLTDISTDIDLISCIYVFYCNNNFMCDGITNSSPCSPQDSIFLHQEYLKNSNRLNWIPENYQYITKTPPTYHRNTADIRGGEWSSEKWEVWANSTQVSKSRTTY